ncbi:unnamed protein product [Anisakis simplex]|uniref:Uncharacterized protein n=1 Tax=Anisakis simplex TaxID=6269 RepID=A0A3P6SU59_ANISI|nr:unnamed protein product [Anisakis simplex]
MTTVSSKFGRKTTGTFEVVKCNEMVVYSFLDYIFNGSLLHVAIAIDFSTGEQLSPCQQQSSASTSHSFVDDAEFAIRAIAEQFRYYNL